MLKAVRCVLPSEGRLKHCNITQKKIFSVSTTSLGCSSSCWPWIIAPWWQIWLGFRLGLLHTVLTSSLVLLIVKSGTCQPISVASAGSTTPCHAAVALPCIYMLAAQQWQLMTVPDCGPQPSGVPTLLVKLVIVLTVVPLVAVVRVRVGVSRTVAGALAATEGVTDISLPCALLAALHAGKSWQRPWCECYKYDSQPAALQSRGCMVQCGEGGQAAHAYSCCRGLSSYCCSNQHHPHKHGFARHRSLLHQGSPLLLNTAATATIRFLEP